MLTIYWGTIQDDALFYHNAWFNYAIYYFALLCALATVCGQWSQRLPADSTGLRVGMVGVVLSLGLLLAEPLRVSDPRAKDNEAMRGEVALAIAKATGSQAPAPVRKFLAIPPNAWPLAVGIGLQLHRAGQPFCVGEQWSVMFGREYVEQPTDKGLIQVWRINRSHLGPQDQRGAEGIYPLRDGWSLSVLPPRLNLDKEHKSFTLNFRAGGNAGDFEGFGWAAPEDWGTWSAGTRAALVFHPQSEALSDVAVHAEVVPLLAPEKGLNVQRIRIFFNGQRIGNECKVTKENRSLAFVLPAALWNQGARAPADEAARLEFEFPDSVSPATLDQSGGNKDRRPLAIGFQEVCFSLE